LLCFRAKQLLNEAKTKTENLIEKGKNVKN